MAETRYLIDPYLDWVKKEGVPVIEDFAIDLFTAPTADWPRFGVKGGVVHCKGRGDFASMFVLDIGPAKSTSQQRHLYEEVIYVLEGTGSTQLEFSSGEKRSFEWGPHSLFAIPPNARYRHFNGSGRARALLVTTTNLPLVLNTFINEKFVFGSDFDFIERMGKTQYFAGEGEMSTVKTGWLWETNFIPDLGSFELKPIGKRGAGASGVLFSLAEGLMHSHLSEMPVGTYKKAHRHPPGFHVMIVQGTGFSLLWYDFNKDMIRVDWKHGIAFPPAGNQFHQHFNTGDKSARYLATGVGSVRYPMFSDIRRGHGGAVDSADKGALDTSIKEGGNQIEYVDQDPIIHKMWLEEMKRHGVAPMMEKYLPAA